MSDQPHQTSSKYPVSDQPQRADALRNRDRLLQVAIKAFAKSGTDVPLDSIARAAGVGIGTLYRHFPTREALVEMAYRSELARLCDSATTLLQTRTPDVALREWMGSFIEFLAMKRSMVDALRATKGPNENRRAESRARLLDAITLLISAGVTAQVIRSDVESMDILDSLSGVSLATTEPARRERLLDLLMDGLRHRS